MKAKYRIVYGNTSIEAPDGAFLIGRSNECHLVLDDPSVSRVHACIIREESGLFVEDRGSRNGVLLNGTLIRAKTPLNDGDKLEVGHQIIRIVALGRVKESEMTVGLYRCAKCGAWTSSKFSECSECGAELVKGNDGKTGPVSLLNQKDPDRKAKSVIEDQPLTMLCGLAVKAIQVDKLEEAERVVKNVVSIASKRLQGKARLDDKEFAAVCNVLVSMADASKTSTHLSQLFGLHRAAERLMNRDLTERLFDLVRKVHYRACPELSSYLEFLDKNADDFSPGERFIHRRLQTLPKICS